MPRPGGSQRAADEAAFKADLAPVIDQDQAQMHPCAPGGPVRIADQSPSAADLAQVIARCDAAQAKKAVRAMKSSRAWARLACNLNKQQRTKERIKWEAPLPFTAEQLLVAKKLAGLGSVSCRARAAELPCRAS